MQETETLRATRRQAIAAGLALAALPVALAAPALAQQAGAQQAGRKTYVLIHGGWHGGWCWKPVRERLEAMGHRVLTPSLTGLADRSHLLNADVDLQTHVDDIVNLYRWEDLQDVTLVGHSYGGWPVSGALDAVHDRTSTVVFVDSFVPESGKALRDLTSPRIREILDASVAKGELASAPPDPEVFKLADPANGEWLAAHMTPMPNRCNVTPLVMTGGREKVDRKIYIRGMRYPNATFDGYLAMAQTTPGWAGHGLDSGHHVMLDKTDTLVEILTGA